MQIKAFTLHNPKHHANLLNWPEEDAFKYLTLKDKTIIAVADGITRDPIDLPNLPDYNTIIGEVELAIEYPIPSPARKAADLFCDSFLNYAKKSKPSMGTIKNSMLYSNKKIKQLNKNKKIDYLENDFAACVASAGIVSANILYYGFITDCGVAIFSRKGKLKFITKSEGPNPKIGKEIAKESEKYGLGWKDPRWRARTRSHYRNNTKEPLAYGALTGEETAKYYIGIGKKELLPRDYVVFYSDGFLPIIASKKFNITKQFNNLKDYFEKHAEKIDGSEGTVVVIAT